MDNNTNLLLQIQSSFNQLTKVEKKVASFVMENTEQVLYMSITDLADACNVGDTSVYRFCRTMNLEGYQEFKVQLSLCLAGQDSTEHAEKTASPQNLAEFVMQLNIKAIQATCQLLDREALQRVVAMIENARKVYFFGVGDSLLTAKEGFQKFIRVTDKVCCIEDPHMQAIAAAMTTEDDLIVIVSYSGATKDNILVAKEAKKAGAKLACITHYKKSVLTAYADEILLCGAKESPLDGGSMAGKMGQLFLIDLLYQEYYDRNRKVCMQNREKTAKAVNEKLY